MPAAFYCELVNQFCQCLFKLYSVIGFLIERFVWLVMTTKYNIIGNYTNLILVREVVISVKIPSNETN
jgi:hypothetical protein